MTFDPLVPRPIDRPTPIDGDLDSAKIIAAPDDPDDWPAELCRTGDARRERWLADARYASTIVGVGRDKFVGRTRAQALIATRR